MALITLFGLICLCALHAERKSSFAFSEITRQLLAPGTHYRDIPERERMDDAALEELKRAFLERERTDQRKSDYLSEFVHMAKELSISALASSDNADKQKQAVSSSAAAVAELSQSVEDVANQVKEAHNDIQLARTQISEGVNDVHSSTRAIAQMVELANESMVFVEELLSQSDNVTAMSNIIRDIADQTNLLSLNAAIESARAGELGRGFAVVADEVRSLSIRSRESANEISQSISMVQNQMLQVKEHTQEVVQKAKDNASSIDCVEQSLKSLNGSIDRIANKVLVITTSAEQQYVATNEISENIEALLGRAVQNAQIADETVRVAQYLSDQAERSQHRTLAAN